MGDYIRIQTNVGVTALYQALAQGHVAIVEALIKADPSPDHIRMQTSYGETALIVASRKGFAAIVKALIAADPIRSVETLSGQKSLHSAIVEALTAADPSTDTFEHEKANRNHPEVIETMTEPPTTHTHTCDSLLVLCVIAGLCGSLSACIVVGVYCYFAARRKDTTGDIYLEANLEAAQPPAGTETDCGIQKCCGYPKVRHPEKLAALLDAYRRAPKSDQ